ncbi:hypothetical protein AAMO2058_001066000 [Amorphochlora amoebiformis]
MNVEAWRRGFVIAICFLSIPGFLRDAYSPRRLTTKIRHRRTAYKIRHLRGGESAGQAYEEEDEYTTALTAQLLALSNALASERARNAMLSRRIAELEARVTPTDGALAQNQVFEETLMDGSVVNISLEDAREQQIQRNNLVMARLLGRSTITFRNSSDLDRKRELDILFKKKRRSLSFFDRKAELEKYELEMQEREREGESSSMEVEDEEINAEVPTPEPTQQPVFIYMTESKFRTGERSELLGASWDPPETTVIPDPSVQRPDPLPDEKISERKAENFQPAKGEAEEVDGRNPSKIAENGPPSYFIPINQEPNSEPNLEPNPESKPEHTPEPILLEPNPPNPNFPEPNLLEANSEPKIPLSKAHAEANMAPKSDPIFQPNTSEPNIWEPKTSEFNSSEPKTSEPQTSEPKISEPKISEPKISDPNMESRMDLGEIEGGRSELGWDVKAGKGVEKEKREREGEEEEEEREAVRLLKVVNARNKVQEDIGKNSLGSVEKRFDPKDSKLYTKYEFFQRYKSLDEWELAQKQRDLTYRDKSEAKTERSDLRDVVLWSGKDVGRWIYDIKDEYGITDLSAEKFTAYGVNGDILLDLTPQDIRDIGLRKTQADAIFAAINALKDSKV